MVTNGWLLPPKVDAIAASGITTIFISIDSEHAQLHEENRGLKGVCARIKDANTRLAAKGVTPIASVAMTRLVKDYEALGHFLKELGFAAVTFSYPRKAAARLLLPGLFRGQRPRRHVPGRAADRLRRASSRPAPSSPCTTRAPPSPTCAAA